MPKGGETDRSTGRKDDSAMQPCHHAKEHNPCEKADLKHGHENSRIRAEAPKTASRLKRIEKYCKNRNDGYGKQTVKLKETGKQCPNKQAAYEIENH
jgi:hypothetical protein